MDTRATIIGLAALAQETRLDVFRMLVSCEPKGIAAGEIARALSVPHNTMSSHLAILARAGLIRSERRSRSIVYRADLEQVRAVVTFLLQDCCGGRPDLCAPLIESLISCCAPEPSHA